jgi:Flp pilus assembly CpaF family ATPase
VSLDERNLRVAVKNIARALGDDVSEEQPILDARLSDGSRVSPPSVHPAESAARR